MQKHYSICSVCSSPSSKLPSCSMRFLSDCFWSFREAACTVHNLAGSPLNARRLGASHFIFPTGRCLFLFVCVFCRSTPRRSFFSCLTAAFSPRRPLTSRVAPRYAERLQGSVETILDGLEEKCKPGRPAVHTFASPDDRTRFGGEFMPG